MVAKQLSYDVLVVGAGAAGLTLALQLADEYQIAVLCKSDVTKSSSYWAQGGIAGVLDDRDTVESHVEDTLVAGAGLCREDIVEYVVSQSKESIQWLIDQGVPFTKEKDDEDDTSQGDFADYHLTKEGGHSHRRIIHADDATGKAVTTTLLEKAKAHDNIELIPHQMAVDLIIKKERCVGAYVLNQETKEIDAYRAKSVVLATGGASKTYLYTTNPHGSSGDGIAMAWRAGCRVANMEFNQFHPTCLYHPEAGPFLITEALRGEGGLLRLPHTGERFMLNHDERAELAPRDIVARAIDHEMKRHGIDCVHLDITHKPAEFIQEHFPTIYQFCLKLGIDICTQPIPVVPAAHYSCGGVVIDKQGRTDINGLYAIGECTFTGLHGANRLASNSILECVVYGFAAAKDLQMSLADLELPKKVKAWDESQVTHPDEKVVISHNWEELRRFMWDYVGIVRSDKRLERALRRIELLNQEVHEYYSNFTIHGDLVELRNLILVAELIVRSAMERKESRGLNYTLDYPSLAKEIEDTILTPS